MHLYMIQNKVDGKVYIGKTTQSDLRAYCRRKIWCAANGSSKNQYLDHAVRKYGKENFVVIPIQMKAANNDELSVAEKFLIRMFDSQNRGVGYNLTSGGEGRPGLAPWNKGRTGVYSEKSLLQMSASQKIRVKTHGHTATGRVVSPEQRRRISETMKARGIAPSMDARKKGGQAFASNPESVAKMRLRLLGNQFAKGKKGQT